VREMVRVAESDPRHPLPFSAHTLRVISRQAVAWCVEAYHPIAITTGVDLSTPPNQRDRDTLPRGLPPAETAASRFPATSPTYRGIP
jgi:hypothetical protein